MPESLKWTLSGADASKFKHRLRPVPRALLSFKANPDYESPGDSGGNNVYEVTLVVTDSKGNSDEQDVTVKGHQCRRNPEWSPSLRCSRGLVSR